MAPLTGIVGYGGGSSGLNLAGAGVKQNYGDRAVNGGGRTDDPSYPTYTNIIDYYSISSLGNGTDFGDLTVGRSQLGSCSNSKKAFYCGGYTGGNQNVIDYITVANTGNATDYGDLTVSRRGGATASSTTRAVHGGGNGYDDTMDYFDLGASTGNATDFGNLNHGRESIAACSDLNRGLWAGGYGDYDWNIDYATLDTLGNASDFGDLSEDGTWASGTCDLVRGVWCGRGKGSSQHDRIDYVTVQTLGNATDFGNTISPTRKAMGVCTDGTKAMMNCGFRQQGSPSNTYYKDISYITIQTTGDATNSGYDLTHTRGYTTATSGD